MWSNVAGERRARPLQSSRSTCGDGASGTLQPVDTTLIAGMAVAGLVVGGALDPVGQRLAERSRLAEEQRKAEERERKAAERLARREAEGIEEDSEPDVDRQMDMADEDGGSDASAAASTPAESPDSPSPTKGSDDESEGHPTDDDGEPDDSLGSEADDPMAEIDGIHHLVAQGRSPLRTAAAAVLTGALFAALGAHFGAHSILAPFAVLFAVLVCVSLTDLSYRLVPRWLIYGGVAAVVPLLVLTAALDHDWRSLSGAAIGGLVSFVLFFAIWWFIPRGMGYGDVRLAGLIGIATGYLSLLHAYLAFLGGFIIGLLFGVGMMVVFGSGRKTRIPFAPALALGAVLSVFYGAHLAQSLFGVSS